MVPKKRRIFLPAAGYRNNTSLNNAGSNGNYWSGTLNENNSNNAYNLNFNSGNHDWNNNNRNNGFAVRPVSALTPLLSSSLLYMTLTREQLLLDLYRAYKDARRHKRHRNYQLEFEYHLEENLSELCDDLYHRTYRPRPSTCFIIHDPKMREVFAADFRDRIVHHLFYNYTHVLFERTFIADSYSCISGRGTHYGINRLKHHLRSESRNHTRPCYVLRLDIKGYFMHIHRPTLLALCRKALKQMSHHHSDVEGLTWQQKLDYSFVDYLLTSIIETDCLKDCRMMGSIADWDRLPKDKSLFHSSLGCGLPIGNLSSQLFSNVYLNHFDQYCKRVLGCEHYGRYVDDVYVVSTDKRALQSWIPAMRAFLEERLGLHLHPHKMRIVNEWEGVEFLGAFVKPYSCYISTSSLYRMRNKVKRLKKTTTNHLEASVNSYLGVLSHYDSYHLRCLMFAHHPLLRQCGRFSLSVLKCKFPLR